MATTTRTSELTKVIDCPKCKAPHFNYQLTCKRCGQYIDKADSVTTVNSHSLAVAAGILGVSTVILVVCAIIHAF